MRGKFKNAGTHIILIIASFISVFPLYWMIAAATKQQYGRFGWKIKSWNEFHAESDETDRDAECIKSFF